MNSTIGSKGLVVSAGSQSKHAQNEPTPSDPPHEPPLPIPLLHPMEERVPPGSGVQCAKFPFENSLPPRDSFHSVRDLLPKSGGGQTRPYPLHAWRQAARRTGLCWLCALGVGAGSLSIRAEEAGHQDGPGPRVAQNVATCAAAGREPRELPALPSGVSELKFSEFFVHPMGARGLTLTAKLRGLDGKKARILGYMAQQEQPVPGMFLFSALPVRLNEEHYGLADDLPAATVFVFMPKDRDKVARHTPGLMLLTGTLSVGNREEADGRISTVRLTLDAPAVGGK